MSQVSTALPATTPFVRQGAFATLASVLATGLGVLKRRVRLQADIQHLREMDADRLRDLGIERDEIEVVLATGCLPRRP